MPSATQKRSYGSVIVYSVDGQLARQAIEDLVADLATRPEVQAVVLFGSWADGHRGVGSDVDLLILLADSDRPFPERTVYYRPDEFPLDLDLFPYTIAEVLAGQPLAREALRRGQVLWWREGSGAHPELEKCLALEVRI